MSSSEKSSPGCSGKIYNFFLGFLYCIDWEGRIPVSAVRFHRNSSIVYMCGQNVELSNDPNLNFPYWKGERSPSSAVQLGREPKARTKHLLKEKIMCGRAYSNMLKWLRLTLLCALVRITQGRDPRRTKAFAKQTLLVTANLPPKLLQPGMRIV